MDIIVVKARVLTAEEGGKRKGVIYSGYRPNHVFEFLESGELKATYIGDIKFVDREGLYPGDEAEVIVRFLKGGGVEKYIEVGRKWFINEAHHRMGEAVVLEIIAM